MRTAAGVALALCALAGCFADHPPQLTGDPDPTAGEDTTTTTTAASMTTASPTGEASTTESSTTADPFGATTGTTGPCPMGQPEKTWYVDGDGDGYGPDDSAVLACDPPPGAVELGGDCDDGVFEVNPGAVELCNDLVDDDCDGLRDEYSLDNLECGACLLAEFGGATYWSCQEPLRFLEAEARCQQFGAHLAVPVNAAELGFVRELIHMTIPMLTELHFWSGIHRQEAHWDSCEPLPAADAWISVDGAPVPYLVWRAGEPDNLECMADCMSAGLTDHNCPRENCVEFSDPATGEYKDAFCGGPTFGLMCKAAL